MPRWTPPVPKRFGQLPAGHGLVFTCMHCGRHKATSADGALEAWGKFGIIAEVAARTRCLYEPCKSRGRRGHHVELSPLKAGLGSKKHNQPHQLDTLLAFIRSLKPGGKVG